MLPDVIGIGTVLVDLQVVLAAYPVADTKVPVLGHRQQVGGPVPTALVVLSRLGVKSAFIGKWGDDPVGTGIRADLTTEGIDVTGCVEVRGRASGFAHVWIDQQTGSRTIAYERGDFEPLVASDVPAVFNCRVLHLDGWGGAAAVIAAKQAKQEGVTVFLDAGAPKEATEELLQYVDVVNVPERFVDQFAPTQRLRGDARVADWLMGRGPRTVVFTKGERGAHLYSKNEVWHQPAFEIEAVDTTGAGDVFSGAFVYGMLQQWSNDQTLRFAAAYAALKCTKLGNRDALPDQADVQQLLASNRSEPQQVF